MTTEISECINPTLQLVSIIVLKKINQKVGNKRTNFAVPIECGAKNFPYPTLHNLS